MRLRELDPGAVIAFFPSDHHFVDEEKFGACVRLAFEAAEGHFRAGGSAGHRAGCAGGVVWMD